ncbi:MAG: XdhC family protein [Ilumatobacteraceae bacterium]
MYDTLRDRLRQQLPTSLVTVVDGPMPGRKLLVTPDEVLGGLGDPDLDRIAARGALAELEAGRSGIRHYGPQGQTTPEDLLDAPTLTVFVESWAPPPQMWIFGAVDFTAALSRVGKVLGYRVIVCDAREVFATRRRFPAADEVVVSWPSVVRPARRPAGIARRRVHPDPRPEVRRARDPGRARHTGGVHRGDGQPHRTSDGRRACATSA